jgi:hypothetical protein
MQLRVSETFGTTYLSNIVSLDYEVPRISRVVTSQYVSRARRTCFFLVMFRGFINSANFAVSAVCRGEANNYVILTVEGEYLGTDPVVHLYLAAEDVDPFLSSPAGVTEDYTLSYGANYLPSMGEMLICGPVVSDRFIECAYFYGSKVRARLLFVP